MGFKGWMRRKASKRIRRASLTFNPRLEWLENRILLSGVTVDPLVTSDPTPPLTGTVDDLSAAVEVTIGSNPNVLKATNNGHGTWILPDDSMADSLDDGTYDVQVIARAKDGTVVGFDETTDELSVDTVPPQVTVDSLVTNDPTPPLTGTVDDPNAQVRVVMVGPNVIGYDTVNKGDGTWTLLDNTLSPALADGTYNITVTATDTVQNSVMGDFEDALRIDTIAPVVTVNPLTTEDPTPELTGSINESTLKIEVEVNGKTYVAVDHGNGTWTLPDDMISPPLTDGVYDVYVSATDLAGNIGTAGPVPLQIGIGIGIGTDTTPPAIAVDPLLSSDTTPALSGTVDDPTAVIQVTVAGTTYTATNNGDGTWTLANNTISTALADGVYNIAAVATDTAGNVSTDTTLGELRIDTTAPIVTVNPLTTWDKSPALRGTVNDPLATIKVSVNGKEYQATNHGNGTWTLADNTIKSALRYKTYEVQATATDVAGNRASATNRLTIGYLWPGYHHDLFDDIKDMGNTFRENLCSRLARMHTWLAGLFTHTPWR